MRQNIKTRGLDVDVQRRRGEGRSSVNSNNGAIGMDKGGLVEDVIYVDAKRGDGMWRICVNDSRHCIRSVLIVLLLQCGGRNQWNVMALIRWSLWQCRR
mmetsp:Transcript_17189/g.21730  ORF Transcript_17189/g.21730 Transcript_17189/m.21730 type:complete len:99 (-) Transcript_17189:517-813(-)